MKYVLAALLCGFLVLGAAGVKTANAACPMEYAL